MGAAVAGTRTMRYFATRLLSTVFAATISGALFTAVLA
jgi:hypothetical protein